MSADEKRIRDFAYQIWESEGKPHGQEDRHWEMARKLAEAEALAPDKSTARKASKPKLPKVDGATEPKPAAAKPAANKAAATKTATQKSTAKPEAVAKPAAKPKPPTPTTQAQQPVTTPAGKPRKPSAT
jgi:hypothetical protein